MVPDMQAYLENMRKYLKNRSTFPVEELSQYAGTWIAWSPDGLRIVASAKNLEDLDSLVQAAGENPTQCVIEGIPEEDALIGGGLNAEAS